MEKVNSLCTSCDGTGLYQGFAEEKGFPVVCINCNESGCREILYTPFINRKKKNGVKGVRLSKGSFILTGVGAIGETVTYEEFLNGKLRYT